MVNQVPTVRESDLKNDSPTAQRETSYEALSTNGCYLRDV